MDGHIGVTSVTTTTLMPTSNQKKKRKNVSPPEAGYITTCNIDIRCKAEHRQRKTHFKSFVFIFRFIFSHFQLADLVEIYVKLVYVYTVTRKRKSYPHFGH